MEKDNSRAVNILLCIAGVLCCIGSGFIPAPEGLLADESVSMIQAMQLSYVIIYFAIPSALMVLACILVIAGKMDILSLCSVLAGGVLFAMLDFQLGVTHRTFSGVLINMVGVILVAAAVALQVFATQTGPVKVSRKAAKSRNPKEFRYERSHRPAYDDIYMDAMSAANTDIQKAVDEMSGADKYIALDNLKTEEAEEAAAEAAQKKQEDEIEAMFSALDSGQEIHKTADNGTEEESDDELLAALRTELDAESGQILAEVQAESQQAAEALDLGMPDVSSSAAMTHMAEALETPNRTMTDFYEGIEDIFLDKEE